LQREGRLNTRALVLSSFQEHPQQITLHPQIQAPLPWELNPHSLLFDTFLPSTTRHEIQEGIFNFGDNSSNRAPIQQQLSTWKEEELKKGQAELTMAHIHRWQWLPGVILSSKQGLQVHPVQKPDTQLARQTPGHPTNRMLCVWRVLLGTGSAPTTLGLAPWVTHNCVSSTILSCT